MRILHILGDSKYGGGSLIVLRLAEMARQCGYQVDVLTTDKTFQRVLQQHDVGVIDVDLVRRQINVLRDVIDLLRLASFLRRNRYDIIHTHTSRAGFAGRFAAWIARCPAIVHTVHGFPFHEESSPLELKIYSFIEWISAHWCDRIVTVSEFHRTWALKLKIGNAQKVVAIPNGIPEDRILPDKQRRFIREKLGISEDVLLLFSNGRLARQKGLEYFIQGIPLLKQKINKKFKVVLAGDGPFRERLGKIATHMNVHDDVVFLGFTHEVNNLLAACDIVVLPSLWEGLSISLLEAMAAGKPIITTNIGSNREATHCGEAALLVPPKDPGAIAEAILRLSNDELLSARISARARDIFLAFYTENDMLMQYRNIYLSLSS